MKAERFKTLDDLPDHIYLRPMNNTTGIVMIGSYKSGGKKIPISITVNGLMYMDIKPKTNKMVVRNMYSGYIYQVHPTKVVLDISTEVITSFINRLKTDFYFINPPNKNDFS